MTKYIQIRNTEEIEIEGLKLIGASTKREDSSKIGFFGSGIKYTISYLLRNSLFFKVYSGINEVSFELKEVTLRDQVFNKILVNGEETSITTSWGENWKRWQIFREIITNAFDEENFDISLTETLNPIKDLTTFYVNYEDFKEYYDNLQDYFKPTLVKDLDASIILKDHPSPLNVFKKGIRVLDEKGYGKEPVISLFDYNIPNIDLNEERVASLWEIKWHVTDLLTHSQNQEYLKTLYDAVLNNRKDLFEVQEVLSNLCEYTKLSYEWLNILNSSEEKVLPDGHKSFFVEQKGEDYIQDNKIKFIPTPFVETVKRSFGDGFTGTFKSSEIDEDFVVIEKTISQQSLINESIQLLKNKGMILKLPVESAKFRNKEVQTLIKNETLYISEEVLNKRLLTSCVGLLIEGYIKDRYHAKDSSKEMQASCIELLVSLVIE